MGGGGEDAAGEVKGAGLELKDGEIGEDVAVGVEELVVEDAAGLAGASVGAGDPLAIGAKKGLGGLAFDGGAEGLLAAIGLREIELVEGEERAGDDAREDEDGDDDAIEAGAGGLHGGELGGAIERAEGDEDGDESAERGGVVEDVGDEVEQVVAHGDERRAVADDVADELEEGEDEKEGGEGGEDEDEVAGELAEDVVVKEQREAGAEGLAEATEGGGDGREAAGGGGGAVALGRAEEAG